MGRKKKVIDIDDYRKKLRNDEIIKDGSGHYVPNAILLEELKLSKELGRPTDDLARMFMAIATKLSNRYPYKYPEDKEDCIYYAVMDCLQYWGGFDVTKGTNPFSYFTEVCKNGLLKGWGKLGYNDMPFSKRIYLTDNIYSL